MLELPLGTHSLHIGRVDLGTSPLEAGVASARKAVAVAEAAGGTVFGRRHSYYSWHQWRSVGVFIARTPNKGGIEIRQDLSKHRKILLGTPSPVRDNSESSTSFNAGECGPEQTVFS